MSNDRSIPTAAPADRPSFKIFIDGEQISGEYQVQAVVVAKQVNKVATARVLILDGDPAAEDFKASSSDDFVPGGEIEIHAGYHSDETVLFKGIMIRHGIKAHKDKPSVLQVECKDAAVKLTVGRKNAYFYDVTDAEVIEEIVSAAGLDTDVNSDMLSHPDLVQFHALDWDFVVARAEANGCLVVTDNGTLRVQPPGLGQDPKMMLTYGGNVLEFEAVMDARHQLEGVKSYAWDAANQELQELEAADPGVTPPGNVTASDLAGVIGLEAMDLRHGGQLKDKELQAWADARLLKSRLAQVRGRVRVQGTSEAGPGDLVELGGVGQRFNGKVFVSAVRHEINTENWETDIEFGMPPELFGESPEEMAEAGAGGLLPAVGGLQIGKVTALEGDPDGEYRVQVRIPKINKDDEGVWARVATLDAGDTRGTFFRPEIGDEVILGFLEDDPRNPVILGVLHSSAKPSPIDPTDDNHEKGIVTRSGMKLVFDDDKVSFTLETPNGNKMVISDDEGGFTLTDENGNSYTMNSDGITIESAKDLILKASGDVTIEGTNVTGSASGQFKAEGSSGAEISSGASTVVKGALVQIN